MPSNFKTKVINFIRKIPKGKVASYGQVAAASGSPRAARQVGMILRNLEIEFPPRIYSKAETHWKGRSRKGKTFLGFPSESFPWWRVINNKGIISIKGSWTATKELQKKLLEKDRVEVNKNFTINMEKYRYNG